MRKYGILYGLMILFSISSNAQSPELSGRADSLYSAKNYSAAAKAYLAVADNTLSFLPRKNPFYNAACCYALSGDKKLALDYLEEAVYKEGYRNLDHLKADTDLASIHGEARWMKLLAYLDANKRDLSDPRKARLVTDDIHHFWNAFDLAEKDTAHREEIFIKEYFSKASPGLKDYFVTKIRATWAFARNQAIKPVFYKSIRTNTLQVDKMKDSIYRYFDRLKELYAGATFPDIYFLIGRWNSAGTVSETGLLLGVDQIARTPDIPQSELNLWEKNNFTDLKNIPVIVIHELIHFQQDKIREDSTLLYYALTEGMADFLCELVTGKNPSQRQQDFARTRKKALWKDFSQEMYLDRARNWIANGDQERPDHPADLGYYMGYEICKAYYDRAVDKRAAIQDMLTVQDHKAFLEKSGYAGMMERLP